MPRCPQHQGGPARHSDPCRAHRCPGLWGCVPALPLRDMKATPHLQAQALGRLESTRHPRRPRGDGDLSESAPKGTVPDPQISDPSRELKTSPNTAFAQGGSWLPWTCCQVCKTACFQSEPEEGGRSGAQSTNRYLKSERWDVRRKRSFFD